MTVITSEGFEKSTRHGFGRLLIKVDSTGHKNHDEYMTKSERMAKTSTKRPCGKASHFQLLEG